MKSGHNTGAKPWN